MQKKMFLRTMVSVSLVAFLILAFAVPGVQAQGKFPSRPMTMICPCGAGGGTDAVARMVAVLMEQDLGQPVNVVNRTGGGGAVGHTAGATADSRWVHHDASPQWISPCSTGWGWQR